MCRAFCVVNFHLILAPEAVALSLPGFDFGDEGLPFADAAIQTLTAQYADFDFHHVEPARMFRCVMKLQALKDAMRLGRRKGL